MTHISHSSQLEDSINPDEITIINGGTISQSIKTFESKMDGLSSLSGPSSSRITSLKDELKSGNSTSSKTSVRFEENIDRHSSDLIGIGSFDSESGATRNHDIKDLNYTFELSKSPEILEKGSQNFHAQSPVSSISERSSAKNEHSQQLIFSSYHAKKPSIFDSDPSNIDISEVEHETESLDLSTYSNNEFVHDGYKLNEDCFRKYLSFENVELSTNSSQTLQPREDSTEFKDTSCNDFVKEFDSKFRLNDEAYTYPKSNKAEIHHKRYLELKKILEEKRRKLEMSNEKSIETTKTSHSHSKSDFVSYSTNNIEVHKRSHSEVLGVRPSNLEDVSFASSKLSKIRDFVNESHSNDELEIFTEHPIMELSRSTETSQISHRGSVEPLSNYSGKMQDQETESFFDTDTSSAISDEDMENYRDYDTSPSIGSGIVDNSPLLSNNQPIPIIYLFPLEDECNSNDSVVSKNHRQSVVDTFEIVIRNLDRSDGCHAGRNQSFSIQIRNIRTRKVECVNRHDILIDFEMIHQITRSKILDYNIDMHNDQILVSFHTLRCGMYNLYLKVLLDGITYCLFEDDSQINEEVLEEVCTSSFEQENDSTNSSKSSSYESKSKSDNYENSYVARKLRKFIPVYVSPGILRDFSREFRPHLSEIDIIQMILTEKRFVSVSESPQSKSENGYEPPVNDSPQSQLSDSPISPSMVIDDNSLEAQSRLFLHEFSNTLDNIRKVQVSMKYLLTEVERLNCVAIFITKTREERKTSFQKLFQKATADQSIKPLKVKKYELSVLENGYSNLMQYLQSLKWNSIDGTFSECSGEFPSRSGGSMLLEVSDAIRLMHCIYHGLPFKHHAFWSHIYAIASYCFPRRAMIVILVFFGSCILENCQFLESSDKEYLYRALELLEACKSDKYIYPEWKLQINSITESVKKIEYLPKEKRELLLQLMKGYLFASSSSVELFSRLIMSQLMIASSLFRISWVFAGVSERIYTFEEIVADCSEGVRKGCNSAIKVALTKTWVQNRESLLYLVFQHGDFGKEYVKDCIRCISVLRKHLKGNSTIGNQINDIKGSITIYSHQLESYFDTFRRKTYSVGSLLKRKVIVSSPDNLNPILYTNYNVVISHEGPGVLKWILRDENCTHIVTEVRLALARFLKSKQESAQIGPLWVDRIQMIEIFKRFIK